jgi:hypothetical protein
MFLRLFDLLNLFERKGSFTISDIEIRRLTQTHHYYSFYGTLPIDGNLPNLCNQHANSYGTNLAVITRYAIAIK